MLKPFHDTQIPADVLYLSFRATALATIDLMKLQFGPQEVEVTGRGALECISMLRGTAIQVQLQTLMKTWLKLVPASKAPLTDLDLCVCYCATTELARQSDLNREHHIERLKNGPRPFPELAPLWIASRLRLLQLTWPFLEDTNQLLKSGRLLNDQIDSVSELGDIDEAIQAFLAVLGDWYVDPLLVQHTDLILTDAEQQDLTMFFSRNHRLMNL
ncbi:MAG: hypothetical protein ABJZ55_07745 [Fuerstiella sp.]